MERARADRGDRPGAVRHARGGAEPLPPPRRPRPHARGARAGRGDPARPGRRRPAPSCPSGVSAFLAQPFADEINRGTALRFGALFHDVAKPQTQSRDESGTVLGFPGHAEMGADMARDAMARLRTSERLRSHVAALTRHHLRPGFLVHEAELDRRMFHRYLSATGDAAVDVVAAVDRRPDGDARAQRRGGDRQARRCRAAAARRRARASRRGGARSARPRRRARRRTGDRARPGARASCWPRSPRRGTPARSARGQRRSTTRARFTGEGVAARVRSWPRIPTASSARSSRARSRRRSSPRTRTRSRSWTSIRRRAVTCS